MGSNYGVKWYVFGSAFVLNSLKRRQNIIGQAMNRLIKLFMYEHELYLDWDTEYDPQEYPKKLIEQLNPGNPDSVLRSFLHNLQQSTGQHKALNTMHKLTLVSLLILHSDKFYDTFAEVLPLNGSGCNADQKWLNDNFLRPYQQFLLKCCTSQEMYSKLKVKNGILEIHYYSFDTIFYLINILNKLFPAVEKLSQLCRYYQNQGGSTVKLYTLVTAMQALRLYISLKTIVIQMVKNPHVYLSSREQQRIMKTILGQYIISINEHMKSLILNKYYSPYKLGIKTKLFRNQEQDPKTFKIINGILNSHRDTERQQQRQAQNKTIFEYNTILNKSINSNSSFTFNPKLQQFSFNTSNYSSQMSIVGSPLRVRRTISSKDNNRSDNILFKRTFIIQQQHQLNEQSENQQQDHNQKQKKDKITKKDNTSDSEACQKDQQDQPIISLKEKRVSI